ncbi:hypothetical protein [Methyloceanibacter methanicus]|uniref:hypothetical protein n=1 Tax=Methyloceanibacter methanicus TaxID=1774968 RepID=UPI0026A45586
MGLVDGGADRGFLRKGVLEFGAARLSQAMTSPTVAMPPGNSTSSAAMPVFSFTQAK